MKTDEEIEYHNELCEQADFYGMESLSEDQQAYVDGYISYEKLMEIE